MLKASQEEIAHLGKGPEAIELLIRERRAWMARYSFAPSEISALRVKRDGLKRKR